MEENKTITKSSSQKTNSTKALDFIISGSIFSIFLVVPLFFSGLVSQGIGFEKIMVFYFLVLLGLVAWVTKGVIVGELRLKRTPLDMPILLTTAVLFISTLLSVDVKDSFLGVYGQPTKGFVAFLVFVMFYYLVVNNITKERIKYFFSAFILSSSILVVYSLLQLFGKFVLPMDFTHRESFNPLGSITALTMFVVMIIPSLVIAFTKFEEIFSCRKKVGMFIMKSLIATITLLSFILLLVLNGFTYWPPALLGMVIILMFFLSKIIKATNNNIIFPIAVFLVMVVLMVIGNFNFVNLNVPAEVSLSRGVSWQIAKDTLKTDPLFGSGPSTFYYDFAKHKTMNFNNTQLWNVRFDTASGVLFEMMATIGVLGTLLMIVIILVSVSIIFISLTRSDKKDLSALLLGVFAGFLSIIVYSLLFALNNSTLIIFILYGILTTVIAIHIYPEEFKSLNLSFRSSPKYALALAAVFLTVSAGVVVLFTVGLKMYMADAYAKKAIMSNDNQTKIEYFTKSISLNPQRDEYYINIANSYMALANKAVIDKSDQGLIQDYLGKAIENGQKAVELSPNKAQNNEAIALIYENASFYTRNALEWSEKYYNLASELDPTNPTPALRIALINMAKANIETDEGEKKYFIEEAIKKYDEAIFKKENLASAHYGKSIAYEKLGDMDNAIINLSNANLFSRNNLDYRFELGRMYFNKGVANGITQESTRKITEAEVDNEEGAGEQLSIQTPNVSGVVEKNNEALFSIRKLVIFKMQKLY